MVTLTVVVILVVVEVPGMGVGAVVVDTVDVIIVELRPVPSDNRCTSFPVSGGMVIQEEGFGSSVVAKKSLKN